MNKNIPTRTAVLFVCFLRVALAVPHASRDLDKSKSAETTPFPKGYLSILGFAGGADLSDIQKRLGIAPYYAVGTFCYTSDQPGDKTRLVFEGSGEMGLAEFKVLTAADGLEPRGPQCVPSSAVSNAIETPSHLRLGMEVRILVDQMGAPTCRDALGMKWLRRGEGCEKLSEDTIKWWKRMAETYLPPAVKITISTPQLK